MRSGFLIIFSLNVLRVEIDLFLFKVFFEWFISKLFSFDSFLIIGLKGRVMIIDEVVGKNERSFGVNILLSLCSHRLKINNIL